MNVAKYILCTCSGGSGAQFTVYTMLLFAVFHASFTYGLKIGLDTNATHTQHKQCIFISFSGCVRWNGKRIFIAIYIFFFAVRSFVCSVALGYVVFFTVCSESCLGWCVLKFAVFKSSFCCCCHRVCLWVCLRYLHVHQQFSLVNAIFSVFVCTVKPL